MIASVGRMMRKGGGGLSWPAGMKEHIKAWYDPKKQGMTNFDVIESYADDFTKWRIENTGVTSTQKKIVIAAGTELKYNVTYKGFGNSIAEFDIKYTGNAVIRYQYNKEDGTTGIITINKSGIYHLPASVRTQKNFGFYCNPQTVTEEATIEQLPTSILKDFSGNKHDAYLYGFKGKLNSGVGIYAQDFKNWNYGSAINSNISTKSYNKFHIVKKKADNWFGFTIGVPKTNYYNQSYKLKFTINKKIDDIKFNVVSTDGNLKTTNVYSVKINDGSIIDIPVISEEIFNNKEETNIYYDFGTNKDIEIDVELIADYPNQLCYDGKSYAVAYGLPILTDYTVMAERTWFENRNIFLAKGNITTEAKYAFIFERFKPDGVMAVQSFGAWNDVVSTTDSCISYLTKNKYNGIDIRSGIGADDDMLSIGGALNKGNIELTSVCCHGAIIVADRSFTEEEINWLKDNLFRK
mgnify:CR=1 FL=1|jgi:hypothetical protein